MSDIPPSPPSAPPACARHPDRAAAITCSHCGNFACPECDRRFEGAHVCATCIDEGRVRSAGHPWADRDQLGIPVAAWRSIVMLTTDPGTFFDRVREDRAGLGDAALFGFLAMIPGTIVGGLYQRLLFLFVLSPDGLLGDALGSEFGAAMAQAGGDIVLQTVMGMLLGPFLGIAGQLVMGCVHHGFLAITGGAPAGLEATLKGALYSMGIQFWAVIPVLGFFVGLWMWGLQAVAYARIHGIGLGRSIAAVLVPFCLCGGLVAVSVAVLMLIVGSALG